MRGKSGFTIVELLVVVTIILVLVTGSISLLGVFMRGQGLKQAARVVSQQFMNARQKAASEKVVIFLVIDTKKQAMRVYRDTDPDGPGGPKTYDRTLVLAGPDADVQDGEELPLPKNVEFACDQAYAAGVTCQTTAAAFKPAGTPFVVAFYPDGSCVMPGAKLGWGPDAATADLALVQAGQTAKEYLDVNPGSGKVRKDAFRTE